MKKLIIMAVCAISSYAHGQFQFLGSNHGETDEDIQAIGVGEFGSSSNLAARLHVNNFFCNDATGTFNGYLFRTDGDDDVDNPPAGASL